MTSGQRTIKKAIIILIILFIIIITHQLMFPKIPEPCFNGVLDIGEEKVDCGGVCIKKCPSPPTPPKVDDIRIEWVKFVKDGENYYDLVAKISNSNPSWGVSSVNYRFVVYSDDGEMIKTEKNKTYIMPKGFLKEEGVKYIIEDNFKLNLNINKVDIELFDHAWNEIKDSRDLPDFNSKVVYIKDKKNGYVTDGPEFYYVYGVTENASKYSFRVVDVNVVAYNANNEPIAVGKTNQWDMLGGGGWEFRIFWRESFSGEINYIDYEAQTNVLDTANFMKDFGTGERYIIPR
ncbi:MAG: hypothetical protein KAQ64_03880 [Candidatus Pacebacteria bacterium]|nr:hypothetical protein [Candidatus Paceibacterota bacterium]